jgi:hypothetical protein
LLGDEAGLPPAVIAGRFGVGLSTVYLWASRRAPRADAVPSRTAAGGRGGSMRRARRSCGRWWPSGTIARWTNIESAWRNAPAGHGSAGRPCAAPCGGSGCGVKKTLRASEQDRDDLQQERAVFCERVRQLDAKDLVFLDESGITTAMTRLYARAVSGHAARPHAAIGGG